MSKTGFRHDVPTLRTEVGRTEFGDNRFRGRSVRHDIAGRESFWSVASIAIGGPALAPADAAILDHLTTCAVSADPHIWPLKIARLIASYGVVNPAIGAAHLAFAGALAGPEPVERAACALLELELSLSEGSSIEQDADRFVSTYLTARKNVPGFGVALRPSDERVDLMQTVFEPLGLTDRPYWRLMRSLEQSVLKRIGSPANLGAALAAALLDMGYRPDQIMVLATLILSPNIWANVFEGAEQKADVLLRLPPESINYRGPLPRRSSRATKPSI